MCAISYRRPVQSGSTKCVPFSFLAKPSGKCHQVSRRKINNAIFFHFVNEMIALHHSPLCSMEARTNLSMSVCLTLHAPNPMSFRNVDRLNTNNSVVCCHCFVVFACVVFKGKPLHVVSFLRTQFVAYVALYLRHVLLLTFLPCHGGFWRSHTHSTFIRLFKSAIVWRLHKSDELTKAQTGFTWQTIIRRCEFVSSLFFVCLFEVSHPYAMHVQTILSFNQKEIHTGEDVNSNESMVRKTEQMKFAGHKKLDWIVLTIE